MEHDVLEVIEAAYRLETEPAEWLRDVAEAANRQVGAGLGLLAFYYQITDDGRLKVGSGSSVGMRVEMPPGANQALEFLPPSFIRKSFVRCECATQSEAIDAEMRAQLGDLFDAMAANFGARDVLVLGGVDPTRYGLYLGAWLPEVTRLAPAMRSHWNRVAVHLVAAYRLRRRLAVGEAGRPDTADAVLTPAGTVDHAQGDAQMREARDVLRDAVRAVEKARGGQRKSDPDGALEAWKGLVSTRWSLVDHFDSDGKRYVLARRNEVRLSGLDALAERERQALGWAALSHTNKMIAYEMGISSSTVGVLLHRAIRKLGAATRAEAIDTFLRSYKPTS